MDAIKTEMKNLKEAENSNKIIEKPLEGGGTGLEKFCCLVMNGTKFFLTKQMMELDAPNKFESFNGQTINNSNIYVGTYFGILLRFLQGDITTLDHCNEFEALHVWDLAKFFELQKTCDYFQWRFSSEPPKHGDAANDNALLFGLTRMLIDTASGNYQMRTTQNDLWIACRPSTSILDCPAWQSFFKNDPLHAKANELIRQKHDANRRVITDLTYIFRQTLLTSSSVQHESPIPEAPPAPSPPPLLITPPAPLAPLSSVPHPTPLPPSSGSICSII